MVVYIDESGALNNKDRYFVICALITSTESTKKRIKNIAKHILAKELMKQGHKEIHANKLGVDIKQNILNKLNALDDFSLGYIVADKKRIIEQLYKEKNICYNYLIGHLLKSIIKSCNEDIHIILDNHTIKVGSLNSLEDYIKIKAYTEWNFKHTIKVEFMNSEDCKGIQIVDVVANSIFAKFNYNKEHLYNISSKHFVHKIYFPYSKFGVDKL